FRDALDFGDGGFDRVVRDRGEAGETLGVLRAEPGQPLVVDANNVYGGLAVVQPAGRAEHAVEHLGLHAVAVLVLHAQVGVGQAADSALAVLVQPGRGHAVGAVDLAGYVLPSGRAHAVHQPEIGAALGHPLRAVGTGGDVRHALAHGRRGVFGEQLRRQPAEVHVTIGGDHFVAHGGVSISWRGCERP